MQPIFLIVCHRSSVGCIAYNDIVVSRLADVIEIRAIILEEVNEVVKAREFTIAVGVKPLFVDSIRFQDF